MNYLNLFPLYQDKKDYAETNDLQYGGNYSFNLDYTIQQCLDTFPQIEGLVPALENLAKQFDFSYQKVVEDISFYSVMGERKDNHLPAFYDDMNSIYVKELVRVVRSFQQLRSVDFIRNGWKDLLTRISSYDTFIRTKWNNWASKIIKSRKAQFEQDKKQFNEVEYEIDKNLVMGERLTMLSLFSTGYRKHSTFRESIDWLCEQVTKAPEELPLRASAVAINLITSYRSKVTLAVKEKLNWTNKKVDEVLNYFLDYLESFPSSEYSGVNHLCNPKG